MTGQRGQPLQKQILVDLSVLIAFALVLRVAWHWFAANRDWPDTSVYLSTGQSLLQTGLMTTDVYMPLYPLLLAGLGYNAILWPQLIASALTVACLYLLSRELFSSRQAAILAGIMGGVYPLLIFYANMRLTETFYIALTVFAFWLFYKGRFLGGSILLVLSILVRPSVDVIAPILVITFCSARREASLAIIGKRLAIYGAVYITFMAPWWWHNFIYYGSFVQLNLGAGPTFIVENNPLFDQFGLDFDALAPAWRQFDNISDPLARYHAMTGAAWDYIKSDPAHWLRRCVERFFRFWNPSPGSDSTLVNVVAVASTVPVILGALLQVARSGRQDLFRLAPILLLIAFLTALHSAVHGLPRYRLPLDPFLIVLAGAFYANLGCHVLSILRKNNGSSIRLPSGPPRL